MLRHLHLSNIVNMASDSINLPVQLTREYADEDKTLIDNFIKGDNQAFDLIVEKHADDIAALANRMLGWPGDVDDITQEVFLSALLNIKKFKQNCSLKTWLFTITINKCRSLRLKIANRKRLLFSAARSGDLNISDSCKTNEYNEDRNAKIRSCVTKLPNKYREPVVLHYLQQLETNDICDILGITKNTLRVRLSRARKILKNDLSKLFED